MPIHDSSSIKKKDNLKYSAARRRVRVELRVPCHFKCRQCLDSVQRGSEEFKTVSLLP